ncbi:MAG: serine/threonine protein kinase [Acidobacteriia bacterium]|nr:serine/threonine protein kinase [Terriglobia bacterium]
MERIGRYEILSELGRGAMGIVYRAQDPVIGRTVAIKTIRFGDFSDPDEMQRLKERLFREARSAGILSHPHIVTIYDIGQEGEVAYIAMEFVNGTTLEHVMRQRGALEKAALMSVLGETAAALDYAHSKGIVHRDIKPANIMINEGGAAKIADFGVAKILSHQITQADTVLGTPSYMSPEQIEAKGIDGRADQFSLGVISYQLLTGQKPFLGDTLPALMFKIVREVPQAPHLVNTTLGPEVESVIARAMAKSAGHRFGNCMEFVSGLAKSLESCPDWQPLGRAKLASTGTEPTLTVVRSSSSGMSTEGTVGPVSKPDPKDAQGPMAVAPVPAPAPPTEPPVEVAAGATPRRRQESAGPAASSKGSRAYVVGLSTVVILAVGGYFAYQQMATTPPSSEPVQTVARVPDPSPVQQVAPPATPDPPAVETPKQRSSQEAAGVHGPNVVQIVSTPPGASVNVDDGADKCASPCELEMPPGRHVLHFELAGYRRAVSIITVPKELQISAKLEQLAGTLTVKTTPPGAVIILNGQQQLQLTPAVLQLPIGHYKLQLKSQGHSDYAEEIQVKDQVISNIEVNWNQ